MKNGLGNHHHEKHYNGLKNIKAAFFLNLIFAVFEIIGGLLTNSIAILSDALHDFGDSVSLGIAWYFEKYSEKEPDKAFTFGYSRFSLLGALINSLILVIGSIFVISEAIPRIFNPKEIYPEGMLIVALIGIVINGIAVIRLQKGNSLNEKVVSWHLFEDVLGWGVILFTSIILIFIDVPVIDPILSVIITLYVMFNAIKNLKEVMHVFLEGVPRDCSVECIEKEIIEKTGAKDVHHTHIWSLEGQKNMLSTHIVVSDKIDCNDIITIKQKVRDLMKEKGIDHVTIETEFESENCNNKGCR